MQPHDVGPHRYCTRKRKGQQDNQEEETPIARTNQVDMDRERRVGSPPRDDKNVGDLLRDIAAEQRQLTNALTQMMQMQMMIRDHVRAISAPTSEGRVAGTPRGGRTCATTTDRPLQPRLLPREEEEEEVIEDDKGQPLADELVSIHDEYVALHDDVKEHLNFNQYMNQRKDRKKSRVEQRPRRQTRQHKEFKEIMNKVPLPNCDGSGKTSARAWVHKLDTFLTLKPMRKDKAIQFATMHLKGVAYDWWHHGLVTQNHAIMLNNEP